MFVDVTSLPPTHPQHPQNMRTTMTFDLEGLDPEEIMTHNRPTGLFRYRKDGNIVCKHCTKCRELWSVDQFSRQANAKDKLKPHCKDCVDEYNHGYYRTKAEEDPEYGRKAYQRAKDSDPEFLAKARVANKAAYKADPERFRKQGNARRDILRRRSDQEISEAGLRVHPNGTKKCRTCTVHKPLDQFYIARAFNSGLQNSCKKCQDIARTDRSRSRYEDYWQCLSIPVECYMCGGPYEDVEHLIPTSLPTGLDIPENTRPACAKCNRSGGKWNIPLEHYIWSVNHPTKTRAKILHEIIMSGTWPFSLTTPEEFIEASLNYEEQEVSQWI